MKKTGLFKTLLIMTMTSLMISGCASETVAEEAPAEEIVNPVEELGEIAEELSFAQSVPYEGDEEESAEEPEEASSEPEEEEEEFLPGYKTEEDWKTRHTGSASYIWEPTVVVSLFIDEEEDLWTEEEKDKALEICDIAYTFIEDTMKEEYNTDVDLIYDWKDDPELAYSIRIYEDIPAYVDVVQERYLDNKEAEWVEEVPYRDLCLKYNTSSIAFLYLIPHEGLAYSSMHFVEDGDKIWNEGCLLYLQDGDSDNYDYETPTVYAHELLHLFGAEDFYKSAQVFSEETYDTLKTECSDDIMLRTFAMINGVYTTFPDEVYGEISPVTAYLLGIGDDSVIEDVPELERMEAACFPGKSTDRIF